MGFFPGPDTGFSAWLVHEYPVWQTSRKKLKKRKKEAFPLRLGALKSGQMRWLPLRVGAQSLQKALGRKVRSLERRTCFFLQLMSKAMPCRPAIFVVSSVLASVGRRLSSSPRRARRTFGHTSPLLMVWRKRKSRPRRWQRRSTSKASQALTAMVVSVTWMREMDKLSRRHGLGLSFGIDFLWND